MTHIETNLRVLSDEQLIQVFEKEDINTNDGSNLRGHSPKHTARRPDTKIYDFLTTSAGQLVVKASGYVPLTQ